VSRGRGPRRSQRSFFLATPGAVYLPFIADPATVRTVSEVQRRQVAARGGGPHRHRGARLRPDACADRRGAGGLPLRPLMHRRPPALHLPLVNTALIEQRSSTSTMVAPDGVFQRAPPYC